MAYRNLLTQIKNAQLVKKNDLKVPFSGQDFIIAEILTKLGYIKKAEKKGRMPRRVIDIQLKYEDDKGAMNDFKLISKPSRRLYAGYRDLRPIKNNYGTALISTPKGVMTTAEARKQKLGGELLFEIW